MTLNGLRHRQLIRWMSACAIACVGVGAMAAETTFDRLVNAAREPHNWLTNHGSYNAQHYSTLEAINRQNVKGLRLAYAVALGGTSANENLQATPLVEDGFMYVVDQWGVVYKIDVRSGERGRIVWRMDPGQEKLPQANRGVALWGNLVVSVANGPARVIATSKDTGRVVWETNVHDQPDLQLTAAPLAVKDKIMVGAAGGDMGVRDWLAALDAATGKLVWRKYVIPAPGEPGSNTWKDKNNAWQTGGGAIWVTGAYDVDNDQAIWGIGNPSPMFDATYRPGDNLFTNSAVSWNPDTGAMLWHFQYTPGDMWNYDEVGAHILIDATINGEKRTLLTHPARNGFLYTMERNNGQILVAKPYLDNINWTKGIDQKTGLPLDYDRRKDVQTYSGLANPVQGQMKKMCPSPAGGNSYWPSSYSQRTKMLYVPALTSCADVTLLPQANRRVANWKGGAYRTTEKWETELSMSDPLTGEIKKKVRIPVANYAGALSTAGGLVLTGFTDGTLAAYDDETLDVLWKINLGVGFNAPPITFAVDGRQYVAILSGLGQIARSKNANNPELKDMRNQTMLFVFGL